MLSKCHCGMKYYDIIKKAYDFPFGEGNSFS
jgi:hypothetical protein